MSLLRARAPRAAVLALAVLAAACSDDGSSPLAPGVPPTLAPPKGAALALLRCSASVRSRALSCADASSPAEGARFAVIGGQNVNVKLTSTDVAYDSVAQVFSANLTVQNLLVQRMGSDGATVSGVRVFFHSGPVLTSGTGSVEVANPDGVETFTASSQPYFQYDGALPYEAVSAAKRWEWSVPKTVGSFDFLLLVSAPLVPTVVFDMLVSGNRDIYRVGIDGNDLTRLTSNTGDDRDPTVAEGSVVFTSYRHGNAELYRVSLKALNAGETRLTTTTDNETSPALSPDGTRLAFIRSNASVLGKLWLANADATGATQPTSGFGFSGDVETGPSWFSTAKLTFVSTTAGSADLYNLLVPGSPVKVANQMNDIGDVDPAWNPDGRLAFASSRSGGTDLYAISAGGALSQLTTRTGSDSHPSWLKDGRVVFSCHMGSPRGARLCLVTPGAPAAITEITTPAAAERPVAVYF